MTDDNAWVFDSLVCFLHGPVWNAPILTFIEEKSLIFDPNCKENDNPEFKKLHEEYKTLVDFMLGSFMEELGITAQQFETACAEGRTMQGSTNGMPLPLHRGLFQQIWAANDLRMFVRMMSSRNVEIQMQALELIERRRGQPAHPRRHDNPEAGDITTDGVGIEREEDEILKEVLNQVDLEPKVSEDDSPMDIKELTLMEVPVEVSMINEKSSEHLRPTEIIFNKKTEIDSEELKNRQDYMRAQRDKLVAMKKQIRGKQLQQSTSKDSLRPTLAMAAQVMSNSKMASENTETEPKEEIDSNLQIRKALAKRLKTEVVNTDV